MNYVVRRTLTTKSERKFHNDDLKFLTPHRVGCHASKIDEKFVFSSLRMLGASVFDVTSLLSKEFLMLVSISVAIAQQSCIAF